MIIIATISLSIFYPDKSKDEPKLYVADIEMEYLETGAEIKGLFLNKSNEQVNFVYRLSLHKRSRSGSSSTNQGGLFVAEPGEKVFLSQVNISLKNGEKYSIDLKIYYGQEVIAQKFISSSFDI
ncbi:MAG: curli-like amyloid fiber formation chaperone CsgH [Balneolales bacterium]